ncbi:MAG: hypothetical protein ACP5I4_06540 [Oceanipulchritudo sp.]
MLFLLRFALVNPAQAESFIINWGYYFPAFSSLLLVVSCLRLVRGSRLKSAVSEYWKAWGVCLLLTVLLHGFEEHRFKVVNDEYALLNTSMSMHAYGLSALARDANMLDGKIEHQEFMADKRSLLFQFLLSLVHDVSGYRPSNAFALNAFLTFALLLLLERILRLTTGSSLLVYGGLLLATSLPLVGWTATSAGYDLLNSVLVYAFILAGIAYLEKPGPARMDCLILVGLLLAQARYESLLYLPGMGCIILLGWRKSRAVTITPIAMVSPLFLIPSFLLNLYMFSDPEILGLLSGPESDTFMSAPLLLQNLQDALAFFILPGSSTLNSPVVFLAGIFGVWFLIHSLRAHRGLSGLKAVSVPLVLVIALSCAIFCIVVMAAHFWGQLTDPLASRFALPVFVLLIPCFVFAVDRIGKRALELCIFAAALLLASAQTAIRIQTDEVPCLNGASRLQHWILESASSMPGRNLYIYQYTTGLVAFEKPAMRSVVANAMPMAVLDSVEKYRYENVFAFGLWRQDPETGANIPIRGVINPDENLFVMERVETHVFTKGFEGRLYRITGLR